MRENGFSDVTTMECLNRPHDVRTVVMTMPDLGYGPGRCFSGGEIKLSKPSVGHVEVGQQNLSSDNESEGETEDNDTVKASDAGGGENIETNRRPSKRDVVNASYVCKSGVASLNMNGHTGFLTFATLYPQSANN